MRRPASLVPSAIAAVAILSVSTLAHADAVTVFGFEGISQYDVASVGRNFIPPDTNGAVGKTQYVQPANGGFAVFDKGTGTKTFMSDITFWANAGLTGVNGDARVMYNPAAGRWIVSSFGNSVSDIQIAISDTDNALGTWKSVKFTGFAGGTADYPTLAIDKNAVYIGTNNFKVGCNPAAPSANRLCGTTLNVIPVDSLFNAGAPTVTNMKQFVTPLNYAALGLDQDRGFAQQGVNSLAGGSAGTIVALSMFLDDNVKFTVNGLTSSDATGATLSANTYLNLPGLSDPGPARQPSAAIPGNRRVIDALDERISSSVYEANGRIYMVQTTGSAGDEARVRYTVIDAATGSILDQGDIGDAGFDYYQGSIAVNAFGDVVIGYNRSGLEQRDLNGDGFSDGNISFLARAFTTDAMGKLVANGIEHLLKVSLTDDYHNGSTFGNLAVGRQRWGDYSQVSIDPNDSSIFWLIGQFAREYNLAAFGHPGGTGGSRWGTWIQAIDVNRAVPEPASTALLFLGFGALARHVRRRGHAAR